VTTSTRYPRLARLLQQRCFFLFLAVFALLIAIPFLGDTTSGRKLIGLINVLILVTSVAAVERSWLSVLVACVLGLLMLTAQFVALETASMGYLTLSWGFGAAFYGYTLAHLLHYVLRRDVMTADKLYGAAAAYAMLAIFWAFLHGVLQYFYPGAYALHGTPKTLDMSELIFFSFVVLTSVGFGDIVPTLIQSRFTVILEAVTGVMYVAILIARLTGVYPVTERRG